MRCFIAIILLSTLVSCTTTREKITNSSHGNKGQMSAIKIGQLIKQSSELSSVSFTQLLQLTAGKRVIPIEPESLTDKTILERLGKALDRSLEEHNKITSPVRKLRRINEASRLFENSIATNLNQLAEFKCEIPKNESGKLQRTGYPDLIITHLPSGRIFYLDPKLFESSGRKSSLRSFYYQPSSHGGKVHFDGHHLLVGIEHDGNQGAWRFIGWEIVDLSRLQLTLKTEFQGTNRDIYRDELILQRSEREATSREVNANPKEAGNSR